MEDGMGAGRIMTKASRGLALAAFLMAAPALADSATPEGAKAVLDRYAAIIGQETIDKGVLAVKPDGEAYLVTWDFGAIIPKPEKPDEPSVAIAPFTYRETPKGDGAYAWHADSLPEISITDTTQEAGTMRFATENAVIDADFDPKAQEPMHAKADIGKFTVDFSMKKDDKPFDYHSATLDQHFDFVAKTGAADGTLDVESHAIAGSVAQHVAVSVDAADGAQVDATLNEGARRAGIKVQGLRSKALGELVATLVANRDKSAIDLKQPVAILLVKALPLFDHFSLTGDQGADKLVSAFAVGGFDDAQTTLDFSGATADDHAHWRLAFDKITAASPIFPAWIAGVFPLSFDIDWSVDFHGLDQAAKLAIESGFDGDGGAEMAALNAQPAHLDSKISLRSPVLSLDSTGQASLNPPQSATQRVTVDGLDKLADLIKKIGLDPHDTQRYLGWLANAAKIAKKDADGHLTWDFSGWGPNAIVNGMPLSKLTR